MCLNWGLNLFPTSEINFCCRLEVFPSFKSSSSYICQGPGLGLGLELVLGLELGLGSGLWLGLWSGLGSGLGLSVRLSSGLWRIVKLGVHPVLDPNPNPNPNWSSSCIRS